jgi:hypothetical protein
MATISRRRADDCEPLHVARTRHPAHVVRFGTSADKTAILASIEIMHMIRKRQL